MQIYENCRLAFTPHALLQGLLQVVDFWVRHAMWIGPPSVQVDTDNGAPRVAKCHAVRVDHRNEPDHVVGKNVIVLFWLLSQLLNKLSHNEAAWCLRSMCPCLQKQTFSFFQRYFGKSTDQCYCKHVYIEPANSFRYYFLLVKQPVS